MVMFSGLLLLLPLRPEFGKRRADSDMELVTDGRTLSLYNFTLLWLNNIQREAMTGFQ